MRLHPSFALSTLVLALLVANESAAATPIARFDQAVRYDLSGDPQLAFTTYLASAKAGFAEAQFNVAVMLDSGRGVQANPSGAALWYARAAAHGVSRAAYNLGQIYQLGQGVPQNAGLAQAWFSTSKLPAALKRLVKLQTSAGHKINPLAVPTPIAPNANSEVHTDEVELVWTSKEEPKGASYFIEMESIDQNGSHEVMTGDTKVSSILVLLKGEGNLFAWRVSAVDPVSGQYAVSGWQQFSRK